VFTGLIRYTGVLKQRDSRGLTIAAPELRTQLMLGDSVAVNGVCLTAATLTADGFTADLLTETRTGTTLGALPLHRRVNLEPALKASDALGGHFVQGHVDCTGLLLERRQLSDGTWQLRFGLPAEVRPYALPKGSICVDGVSLTIQQLEPEAFTVQIIPTTWRDTALAEAAVGQAVNLEGDMLVKTVRRTLEQLAQNGGLSLDQLAKWGYSK
jgi:riboflavin synthase